MAVDEGKSRGKQKEQGIIEVLEEGKAVWSSKESREE